MATIKIDINISSSTVGADKLNLPYSKLVTVTTPYVNSGTASVGTSSPVAVVLAGASNTMVYIVNNDPTNYINLQTAAAVIWGSVGPKECALFKVKTGSGLSLLANSAACNYELSYWTI